MPKHSILHIYYTLLSIIRGGLLNVFCFKFKAKNLRVDKGFRYTGEIIWGCGVKVARNVKRYKKCKIGDNVIIGDNVEFRCNGVPNNICIGDYCTINRNSLIGGMVSIGNDCMIGSGSVIIGSNHVFSNPDILIKKQGITSKGIIIENNVWIGANSSVIDGVSIGEGSIIGAGSVVTKRIPPYSVAVGNPCKVIKNRRND